MDRYLNEWGRDSDSDLVGLVAPILAARVATILAGGRALLVAFEGDIAFVVVEGLLGGGNISYIIFPIFIEVPEPDLRIEEGLQVGGSAENEISSQQG